MNVVDFHYSLDFENRTPLLVVSEHENDISSYLRTVRAEFPTWDIKHMITSDSYDVVIPENEPEMKMNDKQEIFVRRIQPVHFESKNDNIQYESDGTYVITGGLGYVGQHIAQTLYDHGAGNIILLSSSKDKLPESWDRNFKPTVIKCDITNKNEVLGVFKNADNVRGIVHCAGVLSDKTLPNLTKEDWEIVYGAKVQGAYNIDECVTELSLTPDFVVLCSSIASAFGGAGQGNYAGANGALDKLARERDNFVSIRWGAWVGGGMAMDETMVRAARMGILGLDYKDAITQFNNITSDMQHKVITVTPLDTDKLPPVPYFSSISTRKTNENVLSELKSLKNTEEREQFVTKQVYEIAESLGVDEIENDSTPWSDMGLDSLSMVEFKNAVDMTFPGIETNDTLLFDYPNIKLLVQYILRNFDLIGAVRRKVKVRGQKMKPMAIISMSCDYPCGLDSPHALFEFLESGKDAMTDFPEDRFDPEAYSHIYIQKGAFLDTMYHFDNEAFHISEAEARVMDPQQRKCLELTDELVCHLNPISQSKLPDTGVFVTGTGYNHDPKTSGPFTATGSSHAILSNRISYTFGLKGPSMTVDTACSSSFVALDAACKAITAGDCSQGIVIGCNMLDDKGYVGTCGAKMLSPNGRCATFSDQADGYARGEGFGGVIIKDLQEAIKDKDNIIAMIESTSIVQDGRSANLTSPNGPSQEECIQFALDRAGLSVDDIDFVETHGTGTALGDPMEIQALANVFKDRKEPLPLGAVKSSMGHMEAGAGMIGLIKAVKCLQQGKVTKNVHCDVYNPRIQPFIDSNQFVIPNKESYPLKEDKKIRHAGISSFGFGGTNSHVIISHRSN